MAILEIWRPIPESPYFAISNLGRVQYLVSGELMEEHVDEDETFGDVYLGVNLLDEHGEEFCAPIDALVVEAFIEGLDGPTIIIHRDNDPWNNAVWNLEVDEDATHAYFNCD